MIARLMWTIWTLVSSVPKKADKLNLSPWPVDSPHKGPVMWKSFHVMMSSWRWWGQWWVVGCWCFGDARFQHQNDWVFLESVPSFIVFLVTWCVVRFSLKPPLFLQAFQELVQNLFQRCKHYMSVHTNQVVGTAAWVKLPAETQNKIREGTVQTEIGCVKLKYTTVSFNQYSEI